MSESAADNLIRRFLADEVTPELVDELEAWVREDKVNARLLAEHGLLEQMMVSQQVEDDASSVMASLLEMEAKAEPIELVSQDFTLEAHAKRKRDPKAISSQQYAAAGSYVLRHALMSKPAFLAYAAAILLLITVVLVPWGGGEEGANPSVADQSDQTPPAEVSPLEILTVASLTGEHGAVWDRRPGHDLYAGQSFRLRKGFAEITTNRGAVAVIEAPATIEFTDHDNAIRLHAGKLVGICETESSQGFLVHTPHLDITDLGTRFGIDAHADTTEVHVFEGKVQAEHVDAPADAQPVVLVANMSARTSADTDVITSIDHDAKRYAQLLPTTIQLPGTGQGIAVRQADPNWEVVAIDGKPLDTPQALQVSGTKTYIKTVPNDPARSQWIAWSPPIQEDHVCTLRTRITIPDEINADTARIDLRFYADAQVRAIVVNGQRKVLDVGPPVFGSWPEDSAQITEHLQAGVNEIELDIANLGPGPGLGAGLVGLKLEWQLIGQADWKQAQ